jgi:hypothetical protein
VTCAVLIGQSHSAALEQALASECSGVEGLVTYRIGNKGRSAERHTIDDEEAIPIAQSVPVDVPIFLALLGTYHNYLGLLISGRAFEFICEHADEAASGTEYIPHRALASAFESYLRGYSMVDRLLAVAKAPLFLLSAPPPKESNDYILNRLLRQGKRIQYGRSVGEVGIERPEARLKLWKMEVMLTRRWARAKGVEFVDAPSECFNSAGFLARKFYHDDATHANSAYGALVVRQILSITDQMRKMAAHG